MRQIVIIDDALSSALMLQEFAQRIDGVSVRIFTDPEAALEACKAHAPDLVMLDYIMPCMNGCEFLRSLRSRHGMDELPVIVVTADVTRETKHAMFVAGANDFLCKPVDDIELVARVSNMLLLSGRQRALQRARIEAEEANLAKTQFLANMSHELRTPLNAVIGFSEILKDGVLGPIGSPRYAEYARDIHESGKILLGLVNDVLDIARIESGQMALNNETIDLQVLLAQCVRLEQPRARRGVIDLLHHAGEAPARLRADSQRTRQMVLNLVTNAIKFTPPTGKVEVRAAVVNDGWLEITVADTGKGIPLAEQKRVFEPFAQVGGHVETAREGVGLGLALTKALIALHGGSIRLRSAPGEGTSVALCFPPERVLAPAPESAGLLTGASLR